MTNWKLRDKISGVEFDEKSTNSLKRDRGHLDLSVAHDPARSANQLPQVSISLREHGGTLSSRVTLPGRLTEEDFNLLSLKVRDLEEHYNDIHSVVGSLEAQKHSENITIRLAELGWILYKALFSDSERSYFSGFRDKYLAESAASKRRLLISPLQILVKSRGLHVPWEFLYTESPYGEDDQIQSIDERFFLGYWAFIRQDVTANRETWTRESKLEKKAIRIFFDDTLTIATRDEAPSIQKLFALQGYDASIALPLDKQMEGKACIADINANPTSLVHFACHSEAPKGAAPFIQISRNYHFSSDELKFGERTLSIQPIAFVNSCKMALLEMQQYSTFVGYFFQRGFSALLATEIRISDPAAWDFAERVYQSFFQPEHGSLVRAVFAARRQMLETSGSLVGFTYRYYGLVDVRPEERE